MTDDEHSDAAGQRVRVETQDLLTIDEAAVVLRTPVATLRYWRHLQTGPYSFRLGRRVFYRRSDLLAWIDAQHDGPHAA